MSRHHSEFGVLNIPDKTPGYAAMLRNGHMLVVTLMSEFFYRILHYCLSKIHFRACTVRGERAYVGICLCPLSFSTLKASNASMFPSATKKKVTCNLTLNFGSVCISTNELCDIHLVELWGW